MAKYSYKKRGNSFYKRENGFYKLINFQKGAYGDYFFINTALHLEGLPLLYAKQLVIPERPKEAECVLRQRVEEISDRAKNYPKVIGFAGNIEEIKSLMTSIIPDIEAWFDKWGDYKNILGADFEDISRLFTDAPIVHKKEFYLLKSYCAALTKDTHAAREYFSLYKAENPALDFSLIDGYMESLIFNQ